MVIRAFIPVVVAGLILTTATFAQSGGADNPHGNLPSGLVCSSCHTSSAWVPLRESPDFRHETSTDFALIGSHSDVTCVSCHAGLLFDSIKGSGNDCANCHDDEHDGIFTRPCEACHSETSFQDVDGLTIHTASSFPLTGAHENTSCESCHEAGYGTAILDLETTCISCHQAGYAENGVIDHVRLGFPVSCENCHGTVTWQTATFDHAAQANGFELLGAHKQSTCDSCHSVPDLGLIFSPSGQNDCVACHQSVYELKHGGSSIPNTCNSCHGVESWEGAVFDHLAGSGGYELVGAHEVLSCEQCHTLPSLDLLFSPSNQDDCVTCHQSSYDSEHAGSGFPTTCLTCHGTTSWSGASFEHALNANGFDLVGAHEVLSCDNCHTVPSLGLLFSPSDQNDCIACHRVNYDDEHTGSGFPTTCLDCHSTDTWSGATFDHDVPFFPIYSGEHSGEWDSCQTCHTVPADYSVFSCLICHEHNQADVDSEHSGVSNYSYDSVSCYNCHPDGKKSEDGGDD
jgi:hypothetical protein